MAVRDEVYVAACSDYEEKRVEECIRRMFEDQGGAEVFYFGVEGFGCSVHVERFSKKFMISR